ncbi:methyltransferase domain-containing protein [Mesorhizobium sp. YR577]|uniref:class I SAM-dependent methyltransferase n=1 Tax=Mesorhizobium sp. YR577 TaxID=1884373 RepID=UPI0008EAD627|nr:methyltransferase domain-containing protein [Mesorhizobium sp. YR577]SFT85597.1 Ubiquinone/menaquinone biosynthesis C-methylase UbiE [Mesorhizobium sp. YR577]
MTTEEDVARHYSHGALERAILDALKTAGKDVDRLDPADLSGADEFHLGWLAATIDLANDLAISPGMKLLDVGAGIGGPARYFAEHHGCTVVGVDVTDEYVSVATSLTGRCGLADLVSFRQASALSLPFEDASFDRATLIHVGMNIGDKAGAFREVHRILKKGGVFGVYDIMNVSGEDLPYPMPWADTLETSFVEAPATYRNLLTKAGLMIVTEKNRRQMALTLGREMRENAAKNGAPPLSLHTLMGPATPQRLGNVMAALAAGSIAPIQMLARNI